MNSQIRKFTEEFAVNEAPVTAKSLLEEILPLLDDYFIGGITFDGAEITYSLPNGQKFIISSKEVV